MSTVWTNRMRLLVSLMLVIAFVLAPMPCALAAEEQLAIFTAMDEPGTVLEDYQRMYGVSGFDWPQEAWIRFNETLRAAITLNPTSDPVLLVLASQLYGAPNRQELSKSAAIRGARSIAINDGLLKQNEAVKTYALYLLPPAFKSTPAEAVVGKSGVTPTKKPTKLLAREEAFPCWKISLIAEEQTICVELDTVTGRVGSVLTLTAEAPWYLPFVHSKLLPQIEQAEASKAAGAATPSPSQTPKPTEAPGSSFEQGALWGATVED